MSLPKLFWGITVCAVFTPFVIFGILAGLCLGFTIAGVKLANGFIAWIEGKKLDTPLG